MDPIQTSVAVCVGNVSIMLLAQQIADAGFTVPQWPGVDAKWRESRMVMILECIENGAVNTEFFGQIIDPDFTVWQDISDREQAATWPTDDAFLSFLKQDPALCAMLRKFIQSVKTAHKNASLAVCETAFDMYAVA